MKKYSLLILLTSLTTILFAKHHKGEMTSLFDGKPLTVGPSSTEQQITGWKKVQSLAKPKKAVPTPFSAPINYMVISNSISRSN